jgi:iron(III) transport system permease protein
VVLAIGAPLAWPFVSLLCTEDGFQAWREPGRLAHLAANSLCLGLATVALALPAGTSAAILLYRTDLPLRGCLRFLIVLTVLVPLPLFASAWQAALGSGGWLPVADWNRATAGDPEVGPGGLVWKPWAQGLGAAIWVHATAGLPWVVLIVGQGLRWVEKELEEDALTATGPWSVLWRVTLPRCRGILGAAGLWVFLQTVTEITVTDTMQVRTFAEEVYTQLVVGDAAAQARSVAVTVPQVLLASGVVLWLANTLDRRLPSLDTWAAQPVVFRLGWARWPCLCISLVGVAVLAGVPLASLVWKAGLAGSPVHWSAAAARDNISRAFQLRRNIIAESFGLAAAVGLVATALGLCTSWLAIGSRWFRAGVVSLAAIGLVVPGPVVGFGLQKAIHWLIALPFGPILVDALYNGPSFVPVFWADLVRFFPYAMALLWPVVRLLPRELRDMALVDGARPGQELRSVVMPLTLPVFIRAAVAVAVLSLGELSAGKLVETPGATTLAHEIFVDMHYGVTVNLSALCLVMLATVLLGTVVLFLADRVRRALAPTVNYPVYS